jgi:hypothetical protein
MPRTALALLLLPLLVGCSTPSPRADAQAPRRDCFLASNVTGFSDATQKNVNVSTGPNELFQLEVFGTCNDLNWTEVIGLRATGGSPWICTGETADVVVPSPIGPQRCSVRAIRRLTEAEARAAREARKH